MDSSWLRALISPFQTILEAIKILNTEDFRLVLVVDKQRRLLGTITDGDIRRGILRNISLTSKVEEIMFRSPIKAPKGASKRELAALMEVNSISSIPLIYSDKVVGLTTLKSVTAQKKHNNPVFLMAGGFGTRLKPLTNHSPKPLLNVGGKPILETILLSFIRAGFENFYISVFYMPEMIKNYFGDGSRWNVNIEYIEEKEPLGTAGALGLLPNNLSELPLIMMNGDILTNVDFERLLDFHNENMVAATMCVREYEYQVPYGVIKGEGNRILSMEEKPIQTFFVNAGIYVLSPDMIKSVPVNTRIDMPDLLDGALQKDQEVLMFPIHEYWLDIGRVDDFDRAQNDIARLGF